MTEKLEDVKKNVRDQYVTIFESYGINPTLIDIYMTIFFSQKPLSLKEISKESGYSVSTVCNTLDIIESMTDVRKFKKPGSKKEYYECMHDTKLVLKKKANETHEKIHALIKTLKESEEALAGEKDGDSVRIREHVTLLRKEYERINNMLDILSTMQIIEE